MRILQGDYDHGHTVRIGPPGIDNWKCKSCGDEGPLRELMARRCLRPLTAEQSQAALLEAIEGPDGS